MTQHLSFATLTTRVNQFFRSIGDKVGRGLDFSGDMGDRLETYDPSEGLLIRVDQEMQSVDLKLEDRGALVLTPASLPGLIKLLEKTFRFDGKTSDRFVFLSYSPEYGRLMKKSECRLSKIEEFYETVGLTLGGVGTGYFEQVSYPTTCEPGLFAPLIDTKTNLPIGIIIGKGSYMVEGRHDSYLLMYKLDYFKKNFPATYQLLAEESRRKYISARYAFGGLGALVSSSLSILDSLQSGNKVVRPVFSTGQAVGEIQEMLTERYRRASLYSECAVGWLERAAIEGNPSLRDRYLSFAGGVIKRLEEKLPEIHKVEDALYLAEAGEPKSNYSRLISQFNEITLVHSIALAYPSTFDLRWKLMKLERRGQLEEADAIRRKISSTGEPLLYQVK